MQEKVLTDISVSITYDSLYYTRILVNDQLLTELDILVLWYLCTIKGLNENLAEYLVIFLVFTPTFAKTGYLFWPEFLNFFGGKFKLGKTNQLFFTCLLVLVFINFVPFLHSFESRASFLQYFFRK